MPKASYRFDAIGTAFEIVTPLVLADEIKDEIRRIINECNNYFSRFIESSEISRIGKYGGALELPKESVVLFEFYELLYELTDGKVSLLVGDSLEALGYDRDYSLHSRGAKQSLNYSEVAVRKGDELTLLEPAIIDIGAAGKGWLVDQIAQVLHKVGMTDYLIDASGDILHKGSNPEKIGLEDPKNLGKVIGEIEIGNQALCASAINRRKWGDDLHHIIDPITGKPTQDIIATWVVADSTMVADGLATALFFSRPEVLKARYNYEYMIVYASGKIEYSELFNTALYREVA